MDTCFQFQVDALSGYCDLGSLPTAFSAKERRWWFWSSTKLRQVLDAAISAIDGTEEVSEGCDPKGKGVSRISSIETLTFPFSEALFFLLMWVLVHVVMNEIMRTGTIGFVPCLVRNSRPPFGHLEETVASVP
jgi:hypothetical protein